MLRLYKNQQIFGFFKFQEVYLELASRNLAAQLPVEKLYYLTLVTFFIY